MVNICFESVVNRLSYERCVADGNVIGLGKVCGSFGEWVSSAWYSSINFSVNNSGKLWSLKQ